VSIRLPACLPRPRMPDLTPSPDFASSVFHALAVGDRFTFPVSPNAAMWFLSVPGCMESVLHAARLDSSIFGSRRAFMIPALWLTIGDLVEGIVAELGHGTRDRVSWNPQAGVEETFARFPSLITPFADSLGFRHDGGRENLVKRTLSVVSRQA
jgi:D-erythronate 2-dehydrogenase